MKKNFSNICNCCYIISNP